MDTGGFTRFGLLLTLFLWSTKMPSRSDWVASHDKKADCTRCPPWGSAQSRTFLLLTAMKSSNWKQTLLGAIWLHLHKWTCSVCKYKCLLLVNENTTAIYFGEFCQKKTKNNNFEMNFLPVVPLQRTCWDCWSLLGCGGEGEAPNLIRLWGNCCGFALAVRGLPTLGFFRWFLPTPEHTRFLPWRTTLCFKWISGEIKDTGASCSTWTGPFNKIQSNAHMHLNKIMRFVGLIWASLHESVNKLVFNKYRALFFVFFGFFFHTQSRQSKEKPDDA